MDFPKVFTELEQQAEVLIGTCLVLKQENQQLRQERDALKVKNQQVMDKITRIIQQLKHVGALEDHE